jgi:hypothetical protein
MTKKKAPLKAVKKEKEEDQDAINLFDLKFKDTPDVVQRLYNSFMKLGSFDKEAYNEVKKKHKEYITPDIELAYKYNSVPETVKADYDLKLKAAKSKIFKDVIFPAEGNDEYLKNPEKYTDFDKAKKVWDTRSRALFNKTFKDYKIRINKQGVIKSV